MNPSQGTYKPFLTNVPIINNKVLQVPNFFHFSQPFGIHYLILSPSSPPFPTVDSQQWGIVRDYLWVLLIKENHFRHEQLPALEHYLQFLNFTFNMQGTMPIIPSIHKYLLNSYVPVTIKVWKATAIIV